MSTPTANRCKRPDEEDLETVRLRWVTIVVAAAFLAGLLLSPKLWLSERSFPLVPPLGWFPPVPPPLDSLWSTALVVLLAGIGLFPRRRWLLVVFLVLAGLYCLGDTTRWQPWVYEYLVMLAALALCRRDSGQGGLAACRLIIACTWFWSGAAKLNGAFIDEVYPWLMEPLVSHLPSWLPLGPGAYVAPVVEIGLGLGVLFRPTRAVAVVLAVVMHLLLLALLGPLGHNWNSVVWPWNVATAVLAMLLFWRWPAGPLAILWPPRFPFARVVLLLFGLLPALSFVGWWDSYLSMSLYSGTPAEGEVRLDARAVERLRLPPDVQEQLQPETDGLSRLDVFQWAIRELNVPDYPEPRAYLGLGRQVARRVGADATVVVVIHGRRHWRTGKRQTSTHSFGGP